MGRVEDFDALYYASRKALLQQTYALTGDLEVSRASVRQAYVHAWQRWRRVPARGEADAWVRREAWRIAARAMAGRPTAGRDVPAGLTGLSRLSHAQRGAIVLRHLALRTDDQIARELGTSPASVSRLTDEAHARMADTAGAGLDTGLDALRATADSTPMPRASAVRREGGRRRRHRRVGWLAAGSLLAGAGIFLLTVRADDPGSGAVSAGSRTGPSPSPSPFPSATTSPDPRPPVTVSQLLDAAAIARLHPGQRWVTSSTTALPQPERRVYSCPPAPLPPPGPVTAWTRDFTTGASPPTLATQTSEVASSASAAAAAYADMVGWAAACPVPRTRLLKSYDLPGVGDQASMMVLRQSPASGPGTVVAVALARTGRVTTSIVEVTYAPVRPRVGALARTLATAVSRLCPRSGGSCGKDPTVRSADPPEYGDARGFLVPVDLVPVPGTAGGWVGTTPQASQHDPSATLCDGADFAGASKIRARTFVIPAATGLPVRFGLTETLARLPGKPAATGFVDRVGRRVDTCESRQPGATVLDARDVSRGPVRARVWTLQFEVNDRAQTVVYRMGLVRRDNLVAQVTMSPAGGFDVTDAGFAAMVVRAGQRLAELA